MIELKKISKLFGKKEALSGVGIRLEKHECYSLVGRNGAGKTTLLKIIAGLMAPDSGTISIDSGEYRQYPFPLRIRRRIGVLFGTETIIDELTGFEYLKFITLAYNISKTKNEIAEVFGYFFENMDDMAKKIKSYATGMRQKIGLCASIIHDPDILILDEPFAGIDPFGAAKYIDFLNVYKKGRILILSSHDLSYLAKVTDKIGVLDRGRLIFTDAVGSFTHDGQKGFEEALFEFVPPHAMEKGLTKKLFEKR
jgi:ABC-type multidrug transport system ATPase subunit